MGTIRRDFTEATKQQFLRWVDEVTPQSGWDKFADAITDISTSQALMQEETNAALYNIELNRDYQRSLIDTNNASRQQIEQIWTNVNQDAATALTKFASAQSDLEGFRQQIDALATAMSNGTSGGALDISYLTEELKASVSSYDKASKLYAQMQTTGLNANSASHDPQSLLTVLKTFGNTITKYLLTLSVSNEWSTPVGPGLVLSFSISAKDGKGGTTINVPGSVAEAQKKELLDMISVDLAGGSVQLDRNGHPIDAPEGNGYSSWNNNTDFNPGKDPAIEGSWSRSHGDKTQTFSLKMSRTSLEACVGVSQDLGNDTSVSSQLGITASRDSRWTDFRSPAPVAVTVEIPDFSKLWKPVKVPEPLKAPAPLAAATLVILAIILIGLEFA